MLCCAVLCCAVLCCAVLCCAVIGCALCTVPSYKFWLWCHRGWECILTVEFRTGRGVQWNEFKPKERRVLVLRLLRQGIPFRTVHLLPAVPALHHVLLSDDRYVTGQWVFSRGWLVIPRSSGAKRCFGQLSAPEEAKEIPCQCVGLSFCVHLESPIAAASVGQNTVFIRRYSLLTRLTLCNVLCSWAQGGVQHAMGGCLIVCRTHTLGTWRCTAKETAAPVQGTADRPRDT